MPQYTRAFDAGGTFFFTLVTERRVPILTSPLARRLLGKAFREVQAERPFRTRAIVLLPDHLHAIWTLPDGDADYPARWAMIKLRFSRDWVAAGGATQPTSESRRRNRRLGVWQRRYYEHLVRKDEFEPLAAYLHFNPVKHGHCRCPHDWPWSSFHRWTDEGRMRRDWLCACEGPIEIPRSMSARDDVE